MLTVYRNGIDKIPDGVKIINDVEQAFSGVKMKGTETVRNLISNIDCGEFINSAVFKDRFGTQLSVSELSTGCKAGIVVEHFPNCIVNTIECGLNAKELIMAFCKNGNILAVDFDLIETIGSLSDSVDIMICGRHFTDVDEFNEFLESELVWG